MMSPLAKYSSLFLLSFVLVLWGSAFPAIRAALDYFSPVHLAVFRFTIASIALGAAALRTSSIRLQWRDGPSVLINGVVGVGFYNLFLNTGQRTVEAGAASLLVNAAPLWTAVWAALFLKERVPPAGILGLLISFLGVGLVSFRHGAHFELNRGALLVVGASVSHSIYIVLMKRNVSKYGALAATTFAVWAGTLFLLLFSKGAVTAVLHAPWRAHILVIYLGLFPAAVAYVLWGVLLERLPASRVVSFLFFVPVTAFIIGWIWLGEHLTWNLVLGGAFIIAGVALVNKTRSKDSA